MERGVKIAVALSGTRRFARMEVIPAGAASRRFSCEHLQRCHSAKMEDAFGKEANKKLFIHHALALLILELGLESLVMQLHVCPSKHKRQTELKSEYSSGLFINRQSSPRTNRTLGLRA